MNESGNDTEYITLKWGTLKAWNIKSEKGIELLKQYYKLGSSFSVMLQHDTQEQKLIICDLIDLMLGEIYLDWEGIYVSKESAKKYVMEYGE